MNNYRIFIEKKEEFQVEAISLRKELNENLNLNIKSLRLLNIYDCNYISSELFEKAKYQVFAEIQTDIVYADIDLSDKLYFAIEFLPGQFDQRASSAVDCIKLIDPKSSVEIQSGKLFIVDNLSSDDLNKVKKYMINKVESREKDLSVLNFDHNVTISDVEIIIDFINLSSDEYDSFLTKYSLAMSKADLACVVDYFKVEKRDPYITELKILDTYWSDHCRHTTFSTVIENIVVEESFIKKELEESLDLYRLMAKKLNRENKDFCLMELATIAARYLRKEGYLNDLEVSEENNACSIYVDVLVDDKLEKYLLQFKNETHNHPTEIEPFGGASTCIGGAIRDPLSGRSYVYQALRVTGAANIYENIDETINGKLPQKVISTKAAHGYSSYGNQIGLATTFVNEIYHEGYQAKRLEVGAVVASAKVENVVRLSPVCNDMVLMFGGRTGRDGIGGATGSSKTHNVNSIEQSSSEVQKGNAPEERKIQRLFKNPKATKLIKKSNDFGAGGVAVAIGELADGLDIYLDRVITKYAGLNPTELAISESQERMSVVIDPKDYQEFIGYCHEENIEVIHIADVTDTNRLVMYYKDKKYVDIKRDFINSAGAKSFSNAMINKVENINPFNRELSGSLVDKVINHLSDDNILSQQGLVEMFDSTIGRSTVLLPFGGVYQKTPTQVSAQKINTDGYTDTTSIMSYGYDPYLTEWSCYHGSQYAVIDAVTKVVAAGAKYNDMRFSYQEYFPKMITDNDWGLPLASLLGAIKIQNDLKLPSIGGKDSMSGNFADLRVPPMLMAFGITTVDASNIISPEFKEAGNYLYLIKHNCLNNYNPNISELINNYNLVNENIVSKNIVSAYALGYGGLIEALVKMSFGNKIGFNINFDENQMFSKAYGSIVVESKTKLDFGTYLGKTDKQIIVNEQVFEQKKLLIANTNKFSKVYPQTTVHTGSVISSHNSTRFVNNYNSPKTPVAYIPVFPGTNCDYDMKKAFNVAGAKTVLKVFRNTTNDDVSNSINEMKDCIDNCEILALSGGFSSGDEPDGSAKFIVNVLNNSLIRKSIENLLSRGGLIIGICNGFQALVKSGLLPYGKFDQVTVNSPTLFRNDLNRHLSLTVNTKVSSLNSPWLSSFELNDIHTIALSHGEGKFVVDEILAKQLFENNQIAFQYVDLNNEPTMESPYNPNGSNFAIEGIISPCGQIIGKMGHTERYENNLFKNIYGNKEQQLFKNAVNYFTKESK